MGALAASCRQLIGYRQEMTEQDIAAIMSMLKRLLTLCAAGSFQDSLETAISFFDLMSLAQLEFQSGPGGGGAKCWPWAQGG